MTHYCLGFAFIGAHVVLVRKNRPEWQAGKLNGVGGHVESGERADEAMAREFYEETGLDVPRDQWRYFALLEGPGFRLDCFFTYLTDIDGLHSPTEEEISLQFINNLYSLNVVPNVRWLIPMAESFERGERTHHFEIKENK